jgi:prephenate dehydrogenase/chorismate mutase/prephenate dehydrogenase
LFSQDESLYIDIILASEKRCQAIGRLVSTYYRLAKLVVQKDRVALICEFEATPKVYQQESNRALEKSNYLINTLSTLLATSEVKANLIAIHT